MLRELDVVVFGASGYSGNRVVTKLQEIISKEGRTTTWGIAGRCRTKLEDTIKNLELKTGKKFDHIPIIIADTQNTQSLNKMALKTRLIINCTGPFKIHGEPVIQSCIQNKCHYIDITAEPQFMELMQLRYGEAAAKEGVYVVIACGLDSIPADMGLDFLQNNFKGTLNSAEVYLEVLLPDYFGSRPVLNYGTWESLIHVMTDYKRLKKIQNKLYKKELSDLKPELHIRRSIHRIPKSVNYAGPYPGGEAVVMRWSQRYFWENRKARPVQVHTYIGGRNILFYCLLFVAFLVLKLLCKFQFTSELLLKHPKMFSLRIFGHQPSEDGTKKIQLIITLHGRGWKGRVEGNENSWMVAKVKGYDGYDITGFCAAVSALVLLDDSQKIPESGGVYTPAPFFTGTNLVEILGRNGLKFEVCGEGEL